MSSSDVGSIEYVSGGYTETEIPAGQEVLFEVAEGHFKALHSNDKVDSVLDPSNIPLNLDFNVAVENAILAGLNTYKEANPTEYLASTIDGGYQDFPAELRRQIEHEVRRIEYAFLVFPLIKEYKKVLESSGNEQEDRMTRDSPGFTLRVLASEVFPSEKIDTFEALLESLDMRALEEIVFSGSEDSGGLILKLPDADTEASIREALPVDASEELKAEVAKRSNGIRKVDVKDFMEILNYLRFSMRDKKYVPKE